jgi:hypothetical protein
MRTHTRRVNAGAMDPMHAARHAGETAGKVSSRSSSEATCKSIRRVGGMMTETALRHCVAASTSVGGQPAGALVIKQGTWRMSAREPADVAAHKQILAANREWGRHHPTPWHLLPNRKHMQRRMQQHMQMQNT